MTRDTVRLIVQLQNCPVPFNAISRRTGVSTTTLWNWRTGRHEPSKSTAAMVQKALTELAPVTFHQLSPPSARYGTQELPPVLAEFTTEQLTRALAIRVQLRVNGQRLEQWRKR